MSRVGRKRKTPSDWAREHPEELEVKKKPGVDGQPVSETLACKFCTTEPHMEQN